jgi:glycosyltransferase involved in cell wall biosynthesis
MVRPQFEDALVLVGDRAGWILDEVAQQLACHLPPDLHCQLASDGWRTARRCTIHLIDRGWAWADGVLDDVHASNRLLGVWWHGRPDSPDRAIQAALERLRACSHRFARFQVTCSSGRRTLAEMGVPADRIVVLPVGVDLAVFRPAVDAASRLEARREIGIPEYSIAIGCFQKDGNGWGEGTEPKLIKGPDLLADALAQLRRRYPVHAVIPGPARGYLKRRLAEAGVPFSAPGMVERHYLPSLYHALDMYCSPSRDEGGPAGALEAMACGIPVVSSRTGIPADLIESGVNGLLAEPGDAGALALAAADLIERPALRSSMARAALIGIQAYDWKLLAVRYASELYAPLR